MRPEQEYKLKTTLRLRHAIKDLKDNLQSSEIHTAAFLVHDVLNALWMTKWTPAIGKHLQDPTICYIALYMLENDGSFKEAKNTTGPVVKFEHCLRLSFLIQIKRLAHQTEPIDYEAASIELQRWYTEKVDSTFNSLRSLMHRAASISFTTMSTPRVIWLDRENFETMLYNGDRVCLDDMRKAFTLMEKDLIDLWENKVLCGLKLHVEYADIAHDLTNRSVGYSFLTDNRNTCFEDQEDCLVKAILANPATRKMFLVRMDAITGQPIWNKATLRAWLYNYAELQGVEITRAEMLSGSPSRITELASMMGWNTKTRSTNLVHIGPNLALLVMYHKGGSMSGQDKLVPHGLDGVTSDILIQDLVLARPFARIAAQVCFPNDKAMRKLYRERLFVNNGKEFKSTHLTALMKHYTLPTMGVGLSVNAFRHIHSVWERKLCPASLEVFELSSMDSVAAAQAGRSRSTDIRIYGVSHDDLHGAPEDVVPLFIDCSTEWQVKCHVVPGGLGLSYKEARSANFAGLVRSGTIHQKTTGKGKDVETITTAVVNTLKPMVQDQIKDAVVNVVKPMLEDLIKKAVQDALQTHCEH